MVTIAQPMLLKASFTTRHHYWCHLMVFASNMGIAIVGVYWIVKCRLHPLSQVECCMSHPPCRINRVAYIMSRIPCRINHVACTYDMSIHATPLTGDILRSDTFDKKVWHSGNVGAHILTTMRHTRKRKRNCKCGDIIMSHDSRSFSVSQNSTTNRMCGNYCQTQQRYLYSHIETELVWECCYSNMRGIT